MIYGADPSAATTHPPSEPVWWYTKNLLTQKYTFVLARLWYEARAKGAEALLCENEHLEIIQVKDPEQVPVLFHLTANKPYSNLHPPVVVAPGSPDISDTEDSRSDAHLAQEKRSSRKQIRSAPRAASRKKGKKRG